MEFVPDIVTLAKALAVAFQWGACLVTEASLRPTSKENDSRDDLRRRMIAMAAITARCQRLKMMECWKRALVKAYCVGG